MTFHLSLCLYEVLSASNLLCQHHKPATTFLSTFKTRLQHPTFQTLSLRGGCKENYFQRMISNSDSILLLGLSVDKVLAGHF